MSADDRSWPHPEAPTAEPEGPANRGGSPRSPASLWFPFQLGLIHSGLWASLSKKAAAIFPVICAFADFKTGQCYPSTATVARLSGVSKFRVLEAIEELSRKGLLKVRKGDSTHSNHYTVMFWGGHASCPPRSQNETTGGHEAMPPVATPGAQNYSQITITKVTNTKNDASAGGDLLEGAEDLVQIIAGELGLKRTGVGELQQLLDAYGVEWVGEAFKEAVRRGKLTLRYMEGILKNWRRTGRVAPRLKSDVERDTRAEFLARSGQNRLDAHRRAEERERAFALVETAIAKLPERELALLKAEAEVECEQEAIPGIVRDAMVTSKVRRKVADKFGIPGL
jgi:DnaD/phage-associated family protein